MTSAAMEGRWSPVRSHLPSNAVLVACGLTRFAAEVPGTGDEGPWRGRGGHQTLREVAGLL